MSLNCLAEKGNSMPEESGTCPVCDEEMKRVPIKSVTDDTDDEIRDLYGMEPDTEVNRCDKDDKTITDDGVSL